MMKQMKYEATQEFEQLAESISDWFTPIECGDLQKTTQ